MQQETSAQSFFKKWTASGIGVLQKKVKTFFAKNRKIAENASYLMLLQGINYALPLITLPYLVRVLGADKYGIVVLAQATAQYFIIISEYGFNLTATQQIATNRNDATKISRIYNSVLFIKITLSLLGLAVFLLIVFSVSKFRSEYLVFILTYGIVFGQSIFPIWLFQGMEKMKFITIVNLFSKAGFAILVFLLINEPSHYLRVPVLNSISFILAGILSLWISATHFKIKLSLPSMEDIKDQLKGGWHIFISTLGISAYRNANILILGFFASNSIVGYYSVAEKAVKIIQSFINPLSQALFPHLSNRFSKITIQESVNTLTRLGIVYGVLLAAVVAVVFYSTGLLSKVFFGEINPTFILNVEILSAIIFFGGLNYFLGVIGLINFNGKKKFTYSVIVAGVINVITSVVLLHFFQLTSIGASVALSFAEVVLFFLIVFHIYKKYPAK